MKIRNGVRRVTLCAMLTAVAFVLSFIESLMPFPMPLPGMKLGLANIVTLFAVFYLSFGETLAVVCARCLLAALMFGSPTQLLFSLSGGVAALTVMCSLRGIKHLSAYGVSMAGAATHNTAQVLAAVLVLSTPSLIGYLAWLLPVSLVTGFAAALAYSFFEPRIRAEIRRELRDVL